jgi:hypothetical protein
MVQTIDNLRTAAPADRIQGDFIDMTVEGDTRDPRLQATGSHHTAHTKEIVHHSGQCTDTGGKVSTRSPPGQRSLGLATRVNLVQERARVRACTGSGGQPTAGRPALAEAASQG